MKCPNCKSTKYHKKGKTTNGLYSRYQCQECQKNWSDSPLSQGRPPLGLVAMSDRERQKRRRAKLLCDRYYEG
jgi:transposase-like protein